MSNIHLPIYSSASHSARVIYPDSWRWPQSLGWFRAKTQDILGASELAEGQDGADPVKPHPALSGMLTAFFWPLVLIKLLFLEKHIEHLMFVQNGGYSPHSHVPLATSGGTSDSTGLALWAKMPQSCFLSPPWSPLGGEPGASDCLGCLSPTSSEFPLNIHAVSSLTRNATLASLSSTICLFLSGHPPLSTSIVTLPFRPPFLSLKCCDLPASFCL